MTIDEGKARLISWCNRQVGYREGANNWNRYADKLDKIEGLTWGPKQNLAWCGEFVLAGFVECFGVQMGLQLQCSPMPTSIPLCSAGASYYKTAGRWRATPELGDVIFFTVNGGINHTGIVTAVGMGAITTVEGNSSDMVARNTYPTNSPRIAGFGRPRWDLLATYDPGPDESADADPQENAPTVVPTELESGETGPVEPNAPESGSELQAAQLPVLRLGAESEAVRSAQTLLIGRGFRCGGPWSGIYQREFPDGEFGPKTEQAVRDFQDGAGVPVSGVIDGETWAALICD